jgi:hypothetical protein
MFLIPLQQLRLIRFAALLRFPSMLHQPPSFSFTPSSGILYGFFSWLSFYVHPYSVDIDEVNETKLQLVEDCLASNALTLLTMGPTFQSHGQLGVVAAVPRGVNIRDTNRNPNQRKRSMCRLTDIVHWARPPESCRRYYNLFRPHLPVARCFTVSAPRG